MVDTIGKSDCGLYTLSNSPITLFLVDFGLSSAVSRYVAKYRAEGRQDKVNNFLGAVYKLYLIIDAVIFVANAIVGSLNQSSTVTQLRIIIRYMDLAYFAYFYFATRASSVALARLVAQIITTMITLLFI